MKRMAMWAGVVALAGCANVGVTRMKSVSAKPESCQVDIYSTEAEVRRPFDVVCLLDAASKPEACKCGGDAIILSDGGVTGEGAATKLVIRYLTPHAPALPPHAAR
jgi:hypothetical protein